jgi:hypothetical protein
LTFLEFTIQFEISKYITAIYQYIVRIPEQFDPDSVCTSNNKISVGDRQPSLKEVKLPEILNFAHQEERLKASFERPPL